MVIIRCFFLVFWWNVELNKELSKVLSHRAWVVFLDSMTHILNNYHFKFSSHMSNCQLFVHSLTACKKELFWNTNLKEHLGEAFEPGGPEWLCGHQVRFPLIIFSTNFLIDLFNHLSWH